MHATIRIFPFLTLVLVPPAVGELVPTDAELAMWIEQLNASRFSVREEAADRLVEAGELAIDRLAHCVAYAEIESSFRALDVLRKLALRDGVGAAKAERALKSLATLPATASAHQAELVLKSLRNVRTFQALKILRRLGATIAYTGITYEEKNLGPSVVFLTFGKSWKGTDKDLEFVGWLSDYRGVHVTLQGPSFDDSSLIHIAEAPTLVGLQLNRASVTDEGIAHVERMPNLRVLQIRYCKLSDDCLAHIDKLGESLSFSVFGSGISKPAFDQLVAKHETWNSRYGRGGFLGIAGRAYQSSEVKGCIVSEVTADQAASAAGIRPRDIITSYNGRPVSQFVPAGRRYSIVERYDEDESPEPSLSELIGQNAPGDKVAVTILRGQTTIEIEVVLGEWP